MSRLWLDLKAAVRTITRSRFVSGLAVVAFALGIGVTTAVFSIFNGVLLQPLPYPHSEQIVAVYATQPACATCPASLPKYHDWRERNRVFSAIGGSTQTSFVMTGRGDRLKRVQSVPRTAFMYSRVIFAMLEMGISFGHTASHSPSFEQLPKPSASA